MKKIFTLLLILSLCVSLTGCGSEQTTKSSDNTTTKTETTKNIETTQESKETTTKGEEITEESKETTTKGEETTEEIKEATIEGVETTTVSNSQSEEAKKDSNKTLVVYFSNTGNTKAIAQAIAEGLKADTYEIIAETPYAADDLDYHNDNSRSTKEMNDKSARPAMVGNVENLEQYDTVYIGYPIWWGEAPRILDTFVESNNFTDKTVIPFCTSTSTGIGSSANTLEELAGTGKWLEGKRFTGSEPQTEIMDWVNSL